MREIEREEDESKKTARWVKALLLFTHKKKSQNRTNGKENKEYSRSVKAERKK